MEAAIQSLLNNPVVCVQPSSVQLPAPASKPSLKPLTCTSSMNQPLPFTASSVKYENRTSTLAAAGSVNVACTQPSAVPSTVSKSILLPVITRSLVSSAPRAFVQAVELFGFTLVRVMLPASFSQVAPPSVEASTKPKSHSSSMSNHVLKFSVPPTGVFSSSMRSVSRCPPPLATSIVPSIGATPDSCSPR